MSRNSAGIKEIGVIGLASSGIDGKFLAGFYRYCVPAKPWLIRDAGHNREGLEALLARPVHAIIAHVTDEGLARLLKQLGKPVIDLAGQVSGFGFTVVRPDDRAIGAMAAQHFLERGYRSFASVSTSKVAFATLRHEGYAAALAAAGFQAPWFVTRGRWSFSAMRSLDATTSDPWLGELPKPLAVLASSDSDAEVVCDRCRFMNLPVPDKVAVLGVDDDTLVCSRTWPPLSSVQIPGEQMGYRTAELIEKIFAGGNVPPGPHLFPPIGVHLRASTDRMAIEDQRIAQALQFIRENALNRLRVSEVVEHLGGDRRNLEKRFRTVTGHTLLTEIHRVRVETARQQLVNTHQTVASIADQCGFYDAKAFTNRFRQFLGTTPGEYRRRNRLI